MSQRARRPGHAEVGSVAEAGISRGLTAVTDLDELADHIAVVLPAQAAVEAVRNVLVVLGLGFVRADDLSGRWLPPPRGLR